MQRADSRSRSRICCQRRTEPARGVACLLGLLLVISGPHQARAAGVTGTDDARSLFSEQLQHKRLPRVAVIGAGIGGASAAYFLNKLLEGQVNIHV